MFKKRPRAEEILRRRLDPNPPSKMEPRYWRRRLFKNSYTYKGKRVEVSGWSVKIQLLGKRQTFSLASSARAQAAAEACQIYQTIVAEGWTAVAQGSVRNRLSPGFVVGTTRSHPEFKSGLEQWKPRLIHRKHLEKLDPRIEQQFSVRIEHGGFSRYFPLGTDNENEAAAQAMKIHKTVVDQGWARTTQEFPSELTLGLRWLDAPVCWTYTTILTHKSSRPYRSVVGTNGGMLKVAIVEPDPGIGYALASCLNNQKSVGWFAAFDDEATALRELIGQHVDLALVNYDLAHQHGSSLLHCLQQTKPGLVSVLYSTFEDSDELFKGTPGGAAVYILKRTQPVGLLDPILDTLKRGSFATQEIAASVRQYFQQVFASLPVGPSLLEVAKLTPREHEILALLAKGALSKEIAQALRISIWTVHGHVKNIFEKLSVHTRTEAVLKYLQK